MREGLQLSIPKRMGFIKIILTVSLLISVLSSFHLWCGERTFPQVPVWDNFTLTGAWELSLFILYCTLLIASLFLKRERLLLFLSVMIAVVFIVTDLNRMQAWFYFYNAMLLVFVFYNGRVDDSNRFTSFFILLQIIFASVYFFCGLNRFGQEFVSQEFASTIEPLKNILSERHYLFSLRIGILVPYFLTFIGLGLIITPVRYLAFALVLIFHVLLFFLLSPVFGNYNYAGWISQLSFMFLSLFLFSGKTKQRYFSPSYLMNVPLFYLVVFFFVIFPFFTMMGIWPKYLTVGFENNKNTKRLIVMNQIEYDSLTLYQRSFCHNQQTNYVLDYHAWSLHELNASCNNDQEVEASVINYVKLVSNQRAKNSQLAVKLP